MKALNIILLVAVLVAATGCASVIDGAIDDALDRRVDDSIREARDALKGYGITPTDDSVLFDRAAPMGERLNEAAGLIQIMLANPNFTLSETLDMALRLLTMLGLEYAPKSE